MMDYPYSNTWMILLLFLDHDLDKAKNLKVLLCAFEKLSSLKINFHKSEMYCFGEAKEMENEYSVVLVPKWIIYIQILRHSNALQEVK
jgi:hypothetical protein